MNQTELLWVFLTGFFGSAHCIGMCGGLVLSLTSKDKTPSKWHFSAYFVGKTLTYTILGGILGWLGFALLQQMETFQQVLFFIAGVVMIITALGLLNVLSKLENHFKITHLSWYKTAFKKVITREKGTTSALSLGLLNGLLPCGLVYGMLAKSATQQLEMAMLTMFVFGLSTIPALMAVGVLSKWANQRWRTHFNRISGILLLLLGFWTTFKATPLHAKAMTSLTGDKHEVHSCCKR